MNSSRQAVQKVSHRHLLYPESVMRIPRPNYPVPFFLSLSHDVRSRVGVRRFIGTVTDILRDENKLLDSTHMG
jgi:hypothetical protein